LVKGHSLACSFSDNIAEIIYYWTAGAAIRESSSDEEDNIVWCSTNKTNEVPLFATNLAKGKRAKVHECVALERWTSKYKIVNCTKKMSFICEVSMAYIFAS
jgi:hypothetical protein